ncbi:fibronectin type III domain-containing protein [Pedobacter sp. BMA]|uniref:fibronectin type III domain-containing protein n=1 Tax=Pedobacter sp. BMA TaxID=1663685 RepID=UPI0006496050|nr:hypothetical protein [Pedobacter sp. BMA]KLT66676.1 hypothetical protein AB669_05775 [Pedobacter sp. BMA]
MHKLSFIFAILFVFTLSTRAQEIKSGDSVKYVNKLLVISKYIGDSVVVRWTAPSYPLWMAVRKAGVEVFRAEFNATTNSLQAETKLTVSPLKPMTLAAMKLHFKPNDTTAAMAAQILYGGVLTGNQTSKNLENLDLLSADQSNRFVYATYLADLYPEIAKALALRFVDKSAQKGKSYLYYLKSDIKGINGMGLEESATMVNTTTYIKPEILHSVDAIGLDKNVRLFWNRLEGDSKYTAYQIERKEANKPYVKRTTTPFVNPDNPNDDKDDESIVFMDSIPQNYIPYTYKIRGITAFGEFGEWVEISVKGRDLTPPVAPANVNAVSQGGKKVRISWTKPFKDKDLAGFVIGRSDNYEGPYTPVDDKLYGIGDTFAFDMNADVHQRNFYLVSAVDTAGNASRSLPAYVTIADSTAPAKPMGLTALIDSLGVVKLHWDMGTEADLSGYNIYRANSPKEQFSVINKAQVADNNYMDMVDINSLTSHAYYKIAALDKTSNPSAYSEMIAVKKPDYIPPTPPQISDFWISENSVKLKFMPSNSSDLKAYFIYRKTDTVFEKIGSLSKLDSMYTDLKLPEKRVLWYSIAAVDSSGLLSEQSFPQRILLATRAVDLPELKLKADKTDKGVVLSWDQKTSLPAGAKLMLYKSYGNNELEQYKLIEDLKLSFTDLEYRKGDAIKYAVRLQLPNGNMSVLSKPIEISM